MKIENNIPIPLPKTRASSLPFLEMKVGQSFIYNQRHINGMVWNWNKRHPETRFTVRKIEDEEWRVWRVR